MFELCMVEFFVVMIVVVNNLLFKFGQEQFFVFVLYGIVVMVINFQMFWQWVIFDCNEVVGFVSVNFDDEVLEEYFCFVLWCINVDVDDQGCGIGCFVVENFIDEVCYCGVDYVNVIYEVGEDGLEVFFCCVGFIFVGEMVYGEVIVEICVFF